MRQPWEALQASLCRTYLRAAVTGQSVEPQALVRSLDGFLVFVIFVGTDRRDNARGKYEKFEHLDNLICSNENSRDKDTLVVRKSTTQQRIIDRTLRSAPHLITEL